MVTYEEIVEQRKRTHALYARSAEIRRAAAEERAKLHDMRKEYLSQQEGERHDTTNHSGS